MRWRLVSVVLCLSPFACALEATPEQVCDRAVNEGCFDAEEARRCSARFEAIEEHAQEQGCEEAGNTYLSCLENVIDGQDGCQGDDPFATCNDELAATQCGR
jgi:hypothetical protein